jgi:probable F420-dependent oxidoreductase
VEALGYHLVMISDHVAVTPDVEERYPAPFYDPFVSLAWLAATTHRVELGTTVVILPYRSPLLVSRMGANLDQLSGGRFILGVGVGWAQEEFRALGVPFHHRGAMSDDYLAAIKALWSSDLASYAGRFVSFQNVASAPRPVRQPHPPIWVGGSSDAALRRVVRFADGWHPIRFSIDWLREEGLPRLRRTAEAEERPVPQLCPRVKLHLTQSPRPEEGRPAGAGTLDQVRRDLEALESLGASYLLLDTYLDDPEATRRHEPAWRTLTTIAEAALDLEHETLR